jgi:hypothetical protein
MQAYNSASSVAFEKFTYVDWRGNDGWPGDGIHSEGS